MYFHRCHTPVVHPCIYNTQFHYYLCLLLLNKEYNHLGIAFDKNSNRRYIETFFHQDTDMYIKGQTIVKVKSFALYSPNNHVIVIDSF